MSDIIVASSNLETANLNALVNFIAYGTKTTAKLGEGERAGVLDSFKSAYGKLPITEADWNDVIKIANGRWPSQANEQAENKAKIAFKKVYLREATMDNTIDNASVTTMAYGLRTRTRKLDVEKTAILTFNHVYGFNPSTAITWDIVRAIAYSGAKR